MKGSRLFVCAGLSILLSVANWAGSQESFAAEEGTISAPAPEAHIGEGGVSSAREWSISPQVAISFPQPVVVGAELRKPSSPGLRIFGELGYLRLPFSGGQKNIQVFSTQAGFRLFPGDRWYFALLSLGYRYIAFSAEMSSFKIDDEVLATHGAIGLHTFFVRAALGGDFHVSPRFLLGFDVGYQIPLLAAAKVNLSDAATGENSANSQALQVDSNPMRRVAKLGLPQVTLLRLTWLLD